MRIKRALITATVSAALLQGCGDTTLLRYSQDLADTANDASKKVETFYSRLQNAHSEMHLTELKLQAEAATPVDPANPGPVCPFAAKDVDARSNAAKFIEIYALKLNDVAHAKNANEVEQALSDARGQLSGFDIHNFNAAGLLSTATTPITTMAKVMGRRGYEAWASRWLKDALTKSSTAFSEQTKVLRQELDADASEAETRAAQLQGRAERVFRKRTAAHASQPELDAALEYAKQATAIRTEISTDNPSKTYDNLLDIHSRLMARATGSVK